VVEQEVRRRPGGRSAQVRAAVMSATLQALATDGPSGFTVADVAKRAGVHETSIYRRWGTRERLAFEALAELSSDLLPVPDTGSIRGDLVRFGELIVSYAATPLGAAVWRTMATIADDESAAAIRARFWRARYAESRRMVDRAIERAELPASVDPRLLLEVFVAAVHFRLLQTHEAVTRDHLQAVAELVVNGLGRAD
jgi:AcrR family transcriptional regulator